MEFTVVSILMVYSFLRKITKMSIKYLFSMVSLRIINHIRGTVRYKLQMI